MVEHVVGGTDQETSVREELRRPPIVGPAQDSSAEIVQRPEQEDLSAETADNHQEVFPEIPGVPMFPAAKRIPV